MMRTIGHHAPRLLAALVCGSILLTVLPSLAPLVPSPVALASAAAAVYLGWLALAHNRRLCERCIASMPLAPSTAAARSWLRLRVAHLFGDRRFAIAYLAVVGCAAVMRTDPVGRYGWAVVQASVVYLLLGYLTHRRLQPWCPYCRHGGEDQTTPEPTVPLATGA